MPNNINNLPCDKDPVSEIKYFNASDETSNVSSYLSSIITKECTYLYALRWKVGRICLQMDIIKAFLFVISGDYIIFAF